MGMSVTIVVTTRNSIRTIKDCLESIKGQTYSTGLVVVDNFSEDGTDDVASAMADHFFQAGPERSAQRNLGAAAARSDIIGFIDSDMILEPAVVESIVRVMHSGPQAVIVPERSIGTGFWVKVRAYERSFYSEAERVEAARFFRSELFRAVGGFDEGLTGPEDWDLTVRIRPRTTIGRSSDGILHVEHYEGYRDACRKKAHYASGLLGYASKHGRITLVRTLMNRRYIRQPWVLLQSPMLSAGLIALKCGELAAVVLASVSAFRSMERR